MLLLSDLLSMPYLTKNDTNNFKRFNMYSGIPTIIEEVKKYGFKVAINNLLLIIVMWKINAKNYKISYLK